MKSGLPALAVMSLLAVASLGSATAQPAYPPQPPEIELGPPPGPPARFVVEPGHWQWAGGRYVWVARHWIPVRRGYAHFIPGHWGMGGRWIPAHWGR